MATPKGQHAIARAVEQSAALHRRDVIAVPDRYVGGDTRDPLATVTRRNGPLLARAEPVDLAGPFAAAERACAVHEGGHAVVAMLTWPGVREVRLATADHPVLNGRAVWSRTVG